MDNPPVMDITTDPNLLLLLARLGLPHMHDHLAGEDDPRLESPVLNPEGQHAPTVQDPYLCHQSAVVPVQWDFPLGRFPGIDMLHAIPTDYNTPFAMPMGPSGNVPHNVAGDVPNVSISFTMSTFRSIPESSLLGTNELSPFSSQPTVHPTSVEGVAYSSTSACSPASNNYSTPFISRSVSSDGGNTPAVTPRIMTPATNTEFDVSTPASPVVGPFRKIILLADQSKAFECNCGDTRIAPKKEMDEHWFLSHCTKLEFVEFKYECECGKRTKSAGDMKRHWQSRRHSEKEFTCPKCREGFTREDALTRHSSNDCGELALGHRANRRMSGKHKKIDKY
ncbi:hypothetical protein AMATHDRAFT_5763 [Amanita thiersii Skay4041]|uniref:C2H2-type domain-containing protein n=1 Tax=Amanita thiersii Skay4041 TaxID=703135 RepID=A0A2A9NJJ7_9AGAR|nr:hypothetical protein AMATHDRAFT_5763 [Amanita thiersii Skay4041]